MRPFDRSGPTVLSRYWTALVQGASVDELERLATALNPETLTAIGRMRALRNEPQPDPAFVTRLEATLLHSTPGAISMPVSVRMAPRPTRPVESFPSPPMLGRIGRILPITMTAALVLAIFGGFLAGRNTDWGAPKATAPAIVAPATPLPEPVLTDATLLDGAFPVEVLPTDGGPIMGLASVLVEPGASGTWLPTCCDGPMVDFLVAGSLTMTTTEAIQVMRADGTLEEIAAETAFVLSPGDTLITRNLIGFDYANTGTTPAELVEWIYLNDFDQYFEGHQLPGWGGPGGLDLTTDIPVFTHPVRVTLKRHVLDPGETVTTLRPDGVLLVVTPNLETDTLRLFGDGAFQAVDSGGAVTIAYALEVVPLLNAGTVPVVGLPPE
jgi:hypothetical protein